MSMYVVFLYPMYITLIEIIEIAQEHARNAPFEKHVHFSTFDSVFRDLAKGQDEKFTIVSFDSLINSYM